MNVLYICSVSLWVGVSMRVCGVFCDMLRCLSMGRVNVVVLLVLVWVMLMMLWLESSVGMVVVWMGDGVL